MIIRTVLWITKDMPVYIYIQKWVKQAHKTMEFTKNNWDQRDIIIKL